MTPGCVIAAAAFPAGGGAGGIGGGRAVKVVVAAAEGGGWLRRGGGWRVGYVAVVVIGGGEGFLVSRGLLFRVVGGSLFAFYGFHTIVFVIADISSSRPAIYTRLSTNALFFFFGCSWLHPIYRWYLNIRFGGNGFNLCLFRFGRIDASIVRYGTDNFVLIVFLISITIIFALHLSHIENCKHKGLVVDVCRPRSDRVVALSCRR